MGRRIFLFLFLAVVVAIAGLSYFSRRSRDAADRGTGGAEEDAKTVILELPKTIPDSAGAGPSSKPARADGG